MHLKLMIPGPIEVEDDVLEWMGAPVHAHYGDEWVAIHNETLDLLRQVFQTSGKVFMMPGSGSLANDAVVQSLFAPGDHIAVGVNGGFGDRMREIVQANGMVAVPVEAEPGQPLDPAAFERALAADPSIVGLIAIHLETSTAILNPVREIAQIARAHNRLFVVDAVSSLAATPLPMDEWGIDACTSASQKALGAAPGLGVVGIGARGWEAIMAQPERPRSWYLDLRRWQWFKENWGNWHPTPVTTPTSVILGLRAALQSLLRDGLEARFQRYETLARRLRDGLRALGMPLFVPEHLMSTVLTAVQSPAGVPSSQVVKYMAEEHHIKIAGGFGPLREQVIRIGHMGGAMTEANIDEVLAALRMYLEVSSAQASVQAPATQHK
jgi:alanine-glyoxylate transaminase/serine-glyoxylate transaminase/serine-pyruvate transaminase